MDAEKKWQEPEFRTCQYCKCRTNAKMRACCAKGRDEDINRAALKSVGEKEGG